MAQGVKGTGPNGRLHKAITPLEVESQARAHAPNMIKVLHGIASNKDTPPAARTAAANSLLDRGLGKAAQAVTIDHQVQITTIERRIIDASPVLDLIDVTETDT